MGSVKRFFPQRCVLAFQRHPRFLLVRRTYLGPILHRFTDIAGFCAHDPTPNPL